MPVKPLKFVFFAFLSALLVACSGPAIQIVPSATVTPAAYPPPAATALPPAYPLPAAVSPYPNPTPQPVVPATTAAVATTPPQATLPPAAIPPASKGELVAFNTLRMFTPTAGWALGEPLSAQNATSGYPATQSIYHTTDGGTDWQDVSPLNVTLNAMAPAYFASPDAAWLVNAFALGEDAFEIEVYRTTDAGNSCQRSSPFQTSDGMPIYTTFAPDQQHGWMVVTTGPGAGSEGLALYATADGGMTWERMMLTDSGNGPPGSLPTSCIKTGFTLQNASQGWATGVCPGGPIFFFVTHDGGKTWSRVAPPPPLGLPADLFQQCQCDLTPPVFVDPAAGFMSISIFQSDGPHAYLYKTEDGGQSWTPVQLPFDQINKPPDFATPQHGWVADNGNHLFASSDAGQTWHPVGALPAENVLSGLNFVDAQTGFLTDGAHVFITQDGGTSWSSIQPAATYTPGQVNSP